MKSLVCSNSILSVITPEWILECYFRYGATSVKDQIPVVLSSPFIV